MITFKISVIKFYKAILHLKRSNFGNHPYNIYLLRLKLKMKTPERRL